jgi:hypothetical protein
MDSTNLDSKPYPKQVEILKAIEELPVRAVIAGNQTGKSAIGGRELSWLIEGKHPYFSVAKGDKDFAKKNFGLPTFTPTK